MLDKLRHYAWEAGIALLSLLLLIGALWGA